MEWEGRVTGAEACNEVIFECLDGPFCCSASMLPNRCGLIGDCVVIHVIAEGIGAFIVKGMKLWSQACFDK